MFSFVENYVCNRKTLKLLEATGWKTIQAWVAAVNFLKESGFYKKLPGLLRVDRQFRESPWEMHNRIE